MQPKKDPTIQTPDRTTGQDQSALRSNGIYLSPAEWGVVALFVLTLLVLTPMLWPRLMPVKATSDSRMPSSLSNDYWLYSQYARSACARYPCLVLGDSVVRGYFVPEDQTLSHYLNEWAGKPLFANMGLDAAHPAALAGLLAYYAPDIRNKALIVHLNPLWFSSEKLDLQSKKEFHFQHPDLVPQFTPDIPCYKAPRSRRLRAVFERTVPFMQWLRHLQIVCFDNTSLTRWTLDHPYRNPITAILKKTPIPPDTGQSPEASRVTPSRFQWVDLKSSLQWRFFTRCIERLKANGNTVFVIVGPFNEQAIDPQDRSAYQTLKTQIETSLRQEKIAHWIAPVLPAELYCDVSHPIGRGYEQLAGQLYQNGAFNAWMLKQPSQ